jgi:hypothetical protein
MAVSTTPQDILNAAYGRSMRNQPGQIATEATELLNLVTRSIRALYSFAARINPTYFANIASVAESAAGATDPAAYWARPETMESIFMLINAAGNARDDNQVLVVPFNDQKAEEGQEAVFRFGQKFYIADASIAGSPAIEFWGSKRADAPATLTTALDALWNETYNDLLVDEVAIYLAIKDLGTQGRSEEVGALVGERDRKLYRFAAFLEHETVNERHRHSHFNRINTETVVPFAQMFAGGSSFELQRLKGGA